MITKTKAVKWYYSYFYRVTYKSVWIWKAELIHDTALTVVILGRLGKIVIHLKQLFFHWNISFSCSLFKQGVMGLMILDVITLHSLASSPTWSCPNNTATDVSKIKPYYDESRSTLFIGVDISIVCLQTDVFSSIGELFVSISNWILGIF